MIHSTKKLTCKRCGSTYFGSSRDNKDELWTRYCHGMGEWHCGYTWLSTEDDDHLVEHTEDHPVIEILHRAWLENDKLKQRLTEIRDLTP